MARHGDTPRGAPGHPRTSAPRPARRLLRSIRAHVAVHRGHRDRRRDPEGGARGVRSPTAVRPAVVASALHRPTPRLPDDCRDARPLHRQHRPEPGSLSRQASPATPGGDRPESRCAMTSPHHTDSPSPDDFGASSDDELDFDLDSVDEEADTALLALLGGALNVADPVPGHVLAAARGAVAWRTIDQ